MAELKPDGPSPNSSPEKDDVKAPNVFERAKEEFEAIFHKEKHHKHHHHHHKETHGLRDDIDDNTEMSDVKAPNVFERAREEMEALIEAIHPNKESKNQDGDSRDSAAKNTKDGLKSEKVDSHSEKNVKVKQENYSVTHKPHHHRKETHGTSDDIDENTPISEVKGPNVFERAKEEIEALIQTLHPKKGSD